MINLGSRHKSVVMEGYSTQVFGLPSPLIGEEFHALMLYSAGMVEGFSLFKEGMYVAMVEFRYSIKKQVDDLKFDHIFQISCIWGHLLSTVQGGGAASN